MSIQFFCERFGKWFKDLPLSSKFVDHDSFVNRFWDVAQNSWKRVSCNEILLQSSALLYHLMKEQQRYFARIGVDFSHLTGKLLSFIQECLPARADAECLKKVVEYARIGEQYEAFIGLAQRLSTACVRNEGDGNLYFACSNAWAFVRVSSVFL